MVCMFHSALCAKNDLILGQEKQIVWFEKWYKHT